MLSLDAVALEIQLRGHFAFVDMTGGGCATVFAGEKRTDIFGDERYAVQLGAGHFEGPGWTNAVGWVEEMSFSKDDGGLSESFLIEEGWNEVDVAVAVVRLIEQ